MTKKIISIALVIITILSAFAITASAASYNTGSYQVNVSSGINVRAGAGTNYSVVGASSKGTTFVVSKTSGSWGFSSSIKCTSGYKSGWVCLEYCKYTGSTNSSRSTYNNVFASLKGSGYSLSQARNSESTSFRKGDFVYVWAWLRDANNNLYKSYSSGTCNMTLSIFRPDGSCAYTHIYKNSDNNWIGTTLNKTGTWKIQSKITGSLSGTNTRTITVQENSSGNVNPTSVSLNCSSVSMNKGSSKTISATVYPSNATNKSITWSTSNSNVATVSNGKIIAKAPGTATIMVKTSNGKTATCKVTVKGITINSLNANFIFAGDIYYLNVSSYGVSASRTWSSSNSSVISVNSSGKITTKKGGSATITVRTSDGYSASKTIYINSKNLWKTGKFDLGNVAKGYTTVTLNKNAGNASIKIVSYDECGLKTSGQMHVTLRSSTGSWIWEGNLSSGGSIKLGSNYSQYRVYIAKKQYPNTVIGNSNDFINAGKCSYWTIEAKSNCFI